jgi:carbamoyl-phosphate synthase large subunit
MLKYKILITGTGGCGVGEGLYKSVFNLSCYDIYTCNNSDNSLFIFDNPQKSFIVPDAFSPKYCKTILKICIDNNISTVIPGSEQELVALTKNRKLFNKNNIHIFANTDEVISTFDNKWQTFIKLNSLGFKTPDSTIDLEDKAFFLRNSFPLVIKPIYGNASKNVFITQNKEEFDCVSKYMSLKNIDFIVQEYIGSASEEFTISILSDFEGQFLGSIILKRKLSAGFSQFIECFEYEKFNEIAIKIANGINSKGPLNIQCRLKNDELYVFEINPRFSGTTPFRTQLGFNELDVLFKKTYENINIFNKDNIKFNYFGVRGFQEKIYNNNKRFK